MRGFSDVSRRAILECVQNGARTVSEIVEGTGLTQSNFSNHLACLRDCGLVIAQQKGRFVYDEFSDPHVGSLLALADEVLADVAKGIDECTRYGVNVPKNG